jgi:hypothetical protein
MASGKSEPIDMHPCRTIVCLTAIGCWSHTAAAQMSAPPIPSVLPGVAKITAANAAGVPQILRRNSLVSQTSADALERKLDVKAPDYLDGLNGKIRGDAGKNFAIAQAPGYLQSQACSMVLEQAKSFPDGR